MRKIGHRIGAVLSADAEEKVVKFLGYGVYEGQAVPVTAVGWMAEVLSGGGLLNPKLKLDSGETVWGCECWWGPEKDIKAWLEKFPDWKIENVSIEEIRKAIRKNEEEV
jgi:hypothetical protein